MAREDQQLRIMVKKRPVIHHKHHQETKIGLEMTHSEATPKKHYKTSFGLESSRQKRGRPTTTWRRTINAELKMCNITWAEAKKSSHEPTQIENSALCPTRGQQD